MAKKKKQDDGRLEGETLAQKIQRTSKKSKSPYVTYDKGVADPVIKKFKEDIDIWEQQPAESDKDYVLFETFLYATLDAGRLSDIAKQSGRKLSTVRSKSYRKKWFMRRDAYKKSISDLTRKIARERLEQSIHAVVDEYDEINKITALALKNPQNLDISEIDNATTRIYAFEKLVTARDKVLANVLKLIDDGKKYNGASIENGEEGIVIRFVKASDKEDE